MSESEDEQLVALALRCAETGEAGHWPTAAGYLADEIYRLRAELAETRPRCTCDYSGLEGEPHKTWCELEGGPHAECADRHDVLERERDEWRTIAVVVGRIALASTTAGDALAECVLDTRVPDRQEAHRLSRAVDVWQATRADNPRTTHRVGDELPVEFAESLRGLLRGGS